MIADIRTQVAVVPATFDTSIAQWGQVKALINKFNKETVRAATTGALDGTYADGVFSLTTVATTIDGVTLVEGDRVLLKDQIDATQNGIYLVDSTGQTLTRADDFLEGSTLMNNTRIAVAEGDSNADTAWLVVSDGVLTVGTSSVLFVKDTGPTDIKRAKGTITGDGTNGVFAIVHNFNLTSYNAYDLKIKSADGKGVWAKHYPTVGAESNSVTIEFDASAVPTTEEVFDVYIECLE